MKILKKIKFRLAVILNCCVPKSKRVLIWEPWNLESNCIAVANYIHGKYQIPVVYVAPASLMGYARNLLLPEISIISLDSWRSKVLFFSSRYIFTAHWLFPRYKTRGQVIVNLWHGIAFKRICKMSGKSGVPATLTVGTSELTKKMFSEAFGVPEASVFVSGYPRNDILIQAKTEKETLKKVLQGNLSTYQQIIIWLPTRRKDHVANHQVDGTPVDNAFQVDHFDVAQFNKLLKRHNALCIVKPHPFDYRKEEGDSWSNLLTIDDAWLWDQGITLYHLTACSDILVSDVSSIIADYLLIDQPVICFSTDFDAYEKTRGFYFDDIEKWLPSQLVRSQDAFFEAAERLLASGRDPWEVKRKDLKAAFFTHTDGASSQRLVDHVFQTATLKKRI